MYYRINFQIVIWYFNDFKWKKRNRIYNPFKRIKLVKLSEYDNYEGKHNQINLLKKADIDELYWLMLNNLNITVLENITDPLNFNYQIRSIYCNHCGTDSKISDKVLENISVINPKNINRLSL